MFRDVQLLVMLAVPALATALLLGAPPAHLRVDAAEMLTLLVMAATAAAAILVALAGRGRPDLAWPAASVVTAAGLSAAGVVAVVPALAPPPAVLAGARLVALVAWLALGVGFLAALRRQRVLDAELSARLWAAEQARFAAADRTHEMRNVVAGLAGAAYLLAEDLTDHGGRRGAAAMAGRAELAAALRAELDRLNRMLESVPRQEVVLDAGYALAPVVTTVAAVRRATGTRIDVDVASELEVHGSAEALAQVLRNLLLNSARHAPGARVRIAAARDGDLVVLRVADDGPGVAPGTESQLTRRGRRDPVTGGDGIGLGISAALMCEHGGALRVLPTPPGGGFVVELDLPATPPAPASQPTVAMPEPRDGTRSHPTLPAARHATSRVAVS